LGWIEYHRIELVREFEPTAAHTLLLAWLLQGAIRVTNAERKLANPSAVVGNAAKEDCLEFGIC
jgi:hypothetical protein